MSKKSKYANVYTKELFQFEWGKVVESQSKNIETGEEYPAKVEVFTVEKRYIQWVWLVDVSIAKKFSLSDFQNMAKGLVSYLKKE